MYFIIMDVMKIYNINSLSITRISIFLEIGLGAHLRLGTALDIIFSLRSEKCHILDSTCFT